MGAAVVHWEVRARDADRLKRFYGDLFSWKVDSGNPMNYGMVDTGLKMGINGGIGGGDSNLAAGVTFYVQVEDLEECLNRAEGMGGRILIRPTDIEGAVTMALFSDPEGNVIGLVKGPQKEPRAAAPKRSAAKKRSARGRGARVRGRGKNRSKR